MREATQLAVGSCRLFEIEVSERVRLGAARLHSESAQQVFTNKVGRLTRHLRHAEIHIRLAEMHWQKLRVAIREMQQMRVAKTRQLVDARVLRLRRVQAQARGGRDRHHME